VGPLTDLVLPDVGEIVGHAEGGDEQDGEKLADSKYGSAHDD